MARPEGHLRVMMSARVLLNLEEADVIFKTAYEKTYAETRDKTQAHTDAVTAYIAYVCPKEGSKDYDPETGGRRFEKGPLFDLAEALIALNAVSKESLIELIISAKDENQSGDVIFRNIDLLGSAAFRNAGVQRLTTAGRDLSEAIHTVYDTDLLFSRNDKDVQTATDLGIAATTIYYTPTGFEYKEPNENKQVKLFFDGDAVAFGSSSEVKYRKNGLDAYTQSEFEDFMKDIEPGPFSAVLAKISALNERFPKDKQPFELSLITARGGPSHSRALAVLKKLGIKVNGITLGRAGADKGKVLEAFKPALYLDDQFTHLSHGAQFCPVGLVHYPTGSPMHEFLQGANIPPEIAKMRQAEKPEAQEEFSKVAAKPASKRTRKPKSAMETGPA
ncbi:MAG: hypothetical protein CMH30_04050 [Micavibrio sp.]|nr:hypothetical protein [Micavibrio sp.]